MKAVAADGLPPADIPGDLEYPLPSPPLSARRPPVEKEAHPTAVQEENKALRFELYMVAKLSSVKGFDCQFDAAHARFIRDRVLANAEEYV